MAVKQPLEVADTKIFEVSALRPPEYNPNVMTQADLDGLEASMSKFGVVEYPVVNTHTGRKGVIVGGSHRVQIADRKGQKTLACVVVDLPLERERELNLRLNKHRGGLDAARLSEFFDAAELTTVGFGEEDLAAWGMLSEAGAADLDSAAASAPAGTESSSEPEQPGGPAADAAKNFADAQATVPPANEDKRPDEPPPEPENPMSLLSVSGPVPYIDAIRAHLREKALDEEQYLGETLARLLGLEILEGGDE